VATALTKCLQDMLSVRQSGSLSVELVCLFVPKKKKKGRKRNRGKTQPNNGIKNMKSIHYTLEIPRGYTETHTQILTHSLTHGNKMYSLLCGRGMRPSERAQRTGKQKPLQAFSVQQSRGPMTLIILLFTCRVLLCWGTWNDAEKSP